jgi:hypothetical protein
MVTVAEEKLVDRRGVPARRERKTATDAMFTEDVGMDLR